jgi:5-dehydro-2-deoxygluconokinase
LPPCESRRSNDADPQGVSTGLDLISIGRVSVDLYGQQIGTRLEDVATFAKAVGGCPANIAIGAARLGLKCALISRVGDEPMGRFVREQLEREGVDTRGLTVDPQRLTSLVLLSVRDQESFPLIFYRDNCADSALCPDDIHDELIANTRSVLVTGTHFSLPQGAQAQRKAIAIARDLGARVILDIDYRPNLWGIGGHGAGETRYARSAQVTNALASVLPECDLIVGTEEELHIAAGLEDTLAALRHIRARSQAIIVCKRGAQGCIVFPGPIPQLLDEGLVAAGMELEVYNVLGAGDAFLAGFLRGYLRDEPHEASARLANACGALAVSRLLCSSEFPTLAELEYYLEHGSTQHALREDPQLNHLHRASTRSARPHELLALAVDHREPGAAPERLARLSRLAVDAAVRVAAGRQGFGVLFGARTPEAMTLRHAADAGLWLGRAVERADSRPLEFECSGSLATQLIEWPMQFTVTCRCQYHPDDPPELRRIQERELLRLAAACRAQGRELLLEVLTGACGDSAADTTPRVLSRIYELGIRPDWWALEAQPGTGHWERCQELITRHDTFCRGIILAVDAPAAAAVASAAVLPIVRGLAAGGTILAGTAQAWLSGQISDAAAVEDIAERFSILSEMWTSARNCRLDQPERSAI